ncbi:MAG: hypothetical protein IJ779_04800, partial [Ruminococcus sp.]|nr:hypothetical protein [Ruminococcus sp.]
NFLACPDSEILRQKVLKCDSIPATFFLVFHCQSFAIIIQELIGGAIIKLFHMKHILFIGGISFRDNTSKG